MAKEGVRPARTAETPPRYSREETARRHLYASSAATAKSMNKSQRDSIRSILASRWETPAAWAPGGVFSGKDFEDRCLRVLLNPPICVPEYPDQVAPGEKLVVAFIRGPFDELPELRPIWYAAFSEMHGDGFPRFFLDYHDKNEGDMRFVDPSSAIVRLVLEETENAQPTNDETEGAEEMELDQAANDETENAEDEFPDEELDILVGN
jgi:hypothetical protein